MGTFSSTGLKKKELERNSGKAPKWVWVLTICVGIVLVIVVSYGLHHNVYHGSMVKTITNLKNVLIEKFNDNTLERVKGDTDLVEENGESRSYMSTKLGGNIVTARVDKEVIGKGLDAKEKVDIRTNYLPIKYKGEIENTIKSFIVDNDVWQGVVVVNFMADNPMLDIKAEGSLHGVLKEFEGVESGQVLTADIFLIGDLSGGEDGLINAVASRCKDMLVDIKDSELNVGFFDCYLVDSDMIKDDLESGNTNLVDILSSLRKECKSVSVSTLIYNESGGVRVRDRGYRW